MKTVKSLSEEGSFDYLVIESTGIGEPLPVAQTFTMDVDSMVPKDDSKTDSLTPATDTRNSLHHFAQLDTLVTVVDGLNIYEVLGSIETLADADNISGMLGNTGAGYEVKAEDIKLTPEQEAGKQQVVDKVMTFSEDILRNLLEQRQLSTNGNKEEMVKRLITAFEKEMMGEVQAQVDDRPISRLWLDQIEFANVIIVSKAAKLLAEQGEAKLKEIEGLIHKLNPKARIIVPRKDHFGDLDTKAVLNTGLFDMEESQQTAKWQQELAAEHNPETEEYGITSMMFIADEAPFHPERLAAILRGFGDYESAAKGASYNVGTSEDDNNKETSGSPEIFKGVVRSKGHLWLANANAYPVHFQSAGAHIDMRPSDRPFLFDIAQKLKEKEREEEKKNDESPQACSDMSSSQGFKDMIKKQVDVHKNEGLWTDLYGDKRTQLIFIGVGLDKNMMKTKLKEALITEDETEALGGIEGWKTLDDPFYGGKLAKAHFEIGPCF